MKKKGFIRTFGDSRFGMGHVCRSLCIFEALKARAGIEAGILLYPDEAEKLLDMLDKNSIEILNEAGKTPAGDFLLYDMPFPDRRFTSAFKNSNSHAKILALDYSDSTDPSLDIVVNLFDHPRMLEGRTENHRAKFISGLEYAIIRKEFQPWREKPCSFNPKIENILVTFGGADPSHNTEKVLECNDIASRKNVVVIIGPRFDFKPPRKNCANVSFIEKSKKVHELMHAADLILCGGGTTMLEAMFLGIPSLIVPQTDDEARFSAYAEEKGATALVKTGECAEIEEKIRMLDNLNLRLKISEKARNLIKGDGAERIAGMLLEEDSQEERKT